MAKLSPGLLVLVVAFLLPVIEASGDPDTRRVVSNTSPSVTSEAPASSPTVTDTSLSLEQYVDLGFPAADRPWSGADMHRAAQTLAALEERRPGSLPRSKSPQSGPMFARVVARENLDLLRSPNVPINARVPDVLEYLQGASMILMLYAEDQATNHRGHAEVAQLIGAQLRLSVATVETMDEFLASLDGNDPHRAEREAGIRQMKSGLASVVAGSIQTLTESHIYEAPDLKQLASCMSDTFPILLPALPERARQEAVHRLSSFNRDPQMEYLRPELEQLLHRVETPRVSSEGNGILQFRKR